MSGDAVLTPAIVYYELRRELLRARKLRGLPGSGPDRRGVAAAAELWARARQQGHPTSPAPDLDFDVILAAQALALSVEAEVIVLTTNIRRLIHARLGNVIAH